MADAVRLLVPRQVEPMLLCDLPGESSVVVAVRAVVDRRPAQVRLIGPRRRVLVVEQPRHELRVAPPAVGGEEPQSVLPNRAADRSADLVYVIDRSNGRQAARLQVIWYRGGVEPVVRKRAEQVPVIGVAAGFRDEIHLDAAQLE